MIQSVFMRSDDPKTLSIWTVYDHPLDYPECFVARRHDVSNGESEPTRWMMRSDRIDVLRSELERFDFYCLGRQEDDEPHIVESWI